ncbi:MAG: tetratricopeptide repeat protein [Pseudomonadota bacterium]
MDIVFQTVRRRPGPWLIRLCGGALTAMISTIAIAGDPVTDCVEAKDNWARLAACTQVIESDDWPGASAAWAWSNRAMANAALKNHLAAFDDHNQALRLDPLNPRAWNNRATSHAAFREYDRAVRDYTEALALNPTYVTALINRATVYEETGAFSLARSDYDRAIELEEAAGNPVDDLRFLRADTSCQLGDHAASIADRRPAFESGLFPSERMESTLSQTGYLRAGGFEAALRAWTEAGCPWE